MNTMTTYVSVVLTGVLVVTPASQAGNQNDAKSKPAWERRGYFGEQHLHTANSPDAFAMGARNTPDDAYNFAKGIAVKKNTTGEMVQKKTPYDWCAVTDHAEYLGIMPLLLEEGNPMQDTPMGKMKKPDFYPGLRQMLP